jgi:NADP-dependent 3-hydroxy acid dehydrogenase YdfG
MPLRAIVTGASHGVGRGVSQALGETGASVFLTGRDAAALAQAAAETRALGGVADASACDLRDDRATALSSRAPSARSEASTCS